MKRNGLVTDKLDKRTTDGVGYHQQPTNFDEINNKSIFLKMANDLDFVGDVGKVENSFVGGDGDGFLAVFLYGAVEPLVGRRRIGLGLAFQFGRRIVKRHRQLRVH